MNFKQALSTGVTSFVNTMPEVAQAVEILAVSINSWLVETINEDAVASTQRYADIRDKLRATRTK